MNAGNYGTGHAPGHSIGHAAKTVTDLRPEIDLDAAALKELFLALEHLNTIIGPITLERVTIGKNVVQLKKSGSDASQYMIVGIWPAGAKEGVTR